MVFLLFGLKRDEKERSKKRGTHTLSISLLRSGETTEKVALFSI
jgi:hypothetical protein